MMISASNSFYATFLCALVFASSGSLHAAQTCDPRDFGAKGDGTTKDTTAIQGAIDACAGKGGGTVRLTAGTYLSAPIVLKSNITLELDAGATLIGSADRADYHDKTQFREPGLQALSQAVALVAVCDKARRPHEREHDDYRDD